MFGQSIHQTLDRLSHVLGGGDDDTAAEQKHRREEIMQSEDRTVRFDLLVSEIISESS